LGKLFGKGPALHHWIAHHISRVGIHEGATGIGDQDQLADAVTQEAIAECGNGHTLALLIPPGEKPEVIGDAAGEAMAGEVEQEAIGPTSQEGGEGIADV
jgi:hypothetical protein